MGQLGVRGSPGAPPATGASVLFVCDSGVCCSPAAELLLRHLLPLPGLEVASAGTRAAVGEPVPDDMVRLLAERGADASLGVARQLSEEMVERADVVVTMTSWQRRDVVLATPAALRRTWTLLSLASALGTLPVVDDDVPRSLRAMSDRAAAHRLGGGGDVPDPWGRGRRACSQVLDLMVPAVATVAESARRELVQARLVAR